MEFKKVDAPVSDGAGVLIAALLVEQHWLSSGKTDVADTEAVARLGEYIAQLEAAAPQVVGMIDAEWELERLTARVNALGT